MLKFLRLLLNAVFGHSYGLVIKSPCFTAAIIEVHTFGVIHLERHFLDGLKPCKNTKKKVEMLFDTWM